MAEVPITEDVLRHDPLVQSVRAYCERLRATADELRRQADLYDALARSSEPVRVVVPRAT